MDFGVIIDTTIGVLILIAAMSAAASTINELIAGLLARRAANLRRTLKALLGRRLPNGAVFWNSFQGTGIISSMIAASSSQPGTLGNQRWFSYLDKKDFASALIGALCPGVPQQALTPGDIVAALETRGVPPSSPLFGAVREVAAASAGVAAFRVEIAQWYDNAVQRAGGIYARNTQISLFAIGFLLSAALYADPIRVAYQLWNDDDLRRSVVEQAQPFLERYGEPEAPDGDRESGPADDIVAVCENSVGETTPEEGSCIASRAPDSSADAGPDVAAGDATSSREVSEDELLAMVGKARDLRGLIEGAFPVGWPGLEQEAFAATRIQCSAAKFDDTEACLDALFAYEAKLSGTGGEDALADAYAVWKESRAMSFGWYWLALWQGLAGFLVLGLASSLGAKIWFDLLRRVVNLRMAGKKPDGAQN